MKRKSIVKTELREVVNVSKLTAFDLIMNVQCELRKAAGLPPPPHWKQTSSSPDWIKNICRKLCGTILKSVLKLRPKNGEVNWRNYGRTIGLIERYKTFLTYDVTKLFNGNGFDEISEDKWEKVRPQLGEETARQYYLKVLELPANDKTPLEKLAGKLLEKQLIHLELAKQTAFLAVAAQNPKTYRRFLDGLAEGFTLYLNENGEFSGDDRRADIHLELLAWQYDIEKMRRVIPQKNNKHLIRELKSLPEFTKKSDDWFKDVFKSIKLSVGPVGRPSRFAAA